MREIARRLRGAGLDTPELDARLLVMAATGLTREMLVLDPAKPITSDQCDHLDAFVLRRLAHEPVSRITGVREFHGRSFLVTPSTLDPRPDSETLVEAALALATEEDRDARSSPLRILDLGTGTGCLLLTLLAELPEATGTGIDISEAALEVAKENARRLGLATRAELRSGDLLRGVDEPYDLVVANPPYIPSAQIGALAPEVRLYDPRLALDGGQDGLAAYRRIAAEAQQVRANRWNGTWFVTEIGAGQADDVCRIISMAGGNQTMGARRFTDLGGHTRCVAWKTHA